MELYTVNEPISKYIYLYTNSVVQISQVKIQVQKSETFRIRDVLFTHFVYHSKHYQNKTCYLKHRLITFTLPNM